METKPLTPEAIPLLEKKMDMTLDDIIKMSKKPATSKGKRPPRPPIKSRGFPNGNASHGNAKVQHYMDSRSSIRQGVLAQRRSNFRSNQFPVTKEFARKAATMPIHNRVVNWNKPRVAATTIQRKSADGSFDGKDKVIPKQKPQTLDARFANMKEQRMRRFANMKEQRMRAMSQQTMRGGDRPTAQKRRAQQQQGRGGIAPRGNGGRLGKFVR